MPSKRKDKPPISSLKFRRVLEGVEKGNAVDTVCKELKMSSGSFYLYLEIVGATAERDYARAKEKRAERRVDQLDELERECLQAVNNSKDKRLANAIVQAYKIKHDRIKWQASKEYGKKYGEKLDLSADIGTRVIRLPAKVKEGADVV
jgi:hypothetical protein